MDQQTFMEIATTVTKLKMYPYFDVAGFILMCLIVREDNPPQSSGNFTGKIIMIIIMFTVHHIHFYHSYKPSSFRVIEL